jgi:DNA-binding CsgD family transcriptional regulator
MDSLDEVLRFLEQLQDPVGVTPPGAEWVMLNHAARSLVGHDVPLTSFGDIVGPVEQQRLERFCRLSCDALAQDVGPITTSVPLKTVDGMRSLWITATAIPAINGSLPSVFLIFRKTAHDPTAHPQSSSYRSEETTQQTALISSPPLILDVTNPSMPNAQLDRLSDQELRVLRSTLNGQRVATVAQQLYLSEHTVRNTLKRINKKLGATSTAELREVFGNASCAPNVTSISTQRVASHFFVPVAHEQHETLPEVPRWSTRPVFGTPALSDSEPCSR